MQGPVVLMSKSSRRLHPATSDGLQPLPAYGKHARTSQELRKRQRLSPFETLLVCFSEKLQLSNKSVKEKSDLLVQGTSEKNVVFGIEGHTVQLTLSPSYACKPGLFCCCCCKNLLHNFTAAEHQFLRHNTCRKGKLSSAFSYTDKVPIVFQNRPR